jgi:(5-formylfuran-3-yl)methyl phosphate synthase
LLMDAVAAAVGPSTSVIAATYADAAALDPPGLAPGALPELVRRTGIAGALVDTYVKDGRGLYGWMDASSLDGLIAATRAAGGSFGVAGQLGIAQLRRVEADIVGVRSAVCRGGDRRAALDAGLVAAAVASVRGHVGGRTVTATPVSRTA